MRYMLLIYGDPSMAPAPETPEFGEMLAGYNAFGEAAGGAGVLKGGDALHPSAMATTVRSRNGQTMTTDGPFAETREQLGGFYIVECANLDDAIKWAAQIPGARDGAVEVRPIADM